VQARLDLNLVSPEAITALSAPDAAVGRPGLDPVLHELVNGCAYGVDLRAREAQEHGETDHRMHALAVWRETPFFTPRERPALGWTEAITRIADTHAPDADQAELAAHFTPAEQVNLTLGIALNNSWNRLATGFRKRSA
jgi:AhpD family alkylhydroperoxidase